ncbi:MAG: hypothetical protein K2M90_07760, partial [Treponemataceae bacterium]|nr:hypothetical protein [Treponemataceae bacterium]
MILRHRTANAFCYHLLAASRAGIAFPQKYRIIEVSFFSEVCMRQVISCMRKYVFLVLLTGGVFVACENIPYNENESRETVWNGAEELTWETHISIPAEKFSAVTEGSQVIFSLAEIASAEYHNIK